MQINGKDVIKITQSQMKGGLETGRSMMVFGKSGAGKTAIVQQYALDKGLKLLNVDLAGELPESVAGIPSVVKDKPFYQRTLDASLEDFFKVEGEGYVLFFDEINQGSPDTLNTLYQITHPDPEQRRWAGHKIGKCQIVACGNLSDGTDGTVYLTELPTPLLNRFFVFELVDSNKETMAYLKEKYHNIPQVAKYIRVMLDNNVSPRDIDQALNIISYEHDAMFLEAKLGTALTAKILDIQNNVKSLDPAELIKNARKIYAQFKEDGEVMFGAETITTEDELKSKLSEFLSDEEIAGVMKGDE
jgi:hypothetical protein